MFCCYPHERAALLDVDDGLARRISDVFLFDDYSPEEVTEIFMLKARKAGYIVSAAIRDHIGTRMTNLHDLGHGMWENGATAEKLLKEIRVSMGLRILSAAEVHAVSAAVQCGDRPVTDLYTIEMADVEAAFERVFANLARKTGREIPV